MAETVDRRGAQQRVRHAVVRVATRLARRLFARTTYTMRGGLAKGYRRRFGYGSLPHFRLTREERFLDALELRGKVIYDVGAFAGTYTMFFARKSGDPARVACFEPHPETYAQLSGNLTLNGLHQLRSFNVAVGSAEGTLDLQMDATFPARSTLDASGGVMREREPNSRSSVRVVRLDDFVEEAGLEPPDLVKLDVEGFEYEALVGMEKILTETHPDLFIELHGSQLAHDVMQLLLEKYGYQVFHVESTSWVRPGRLPAIRLGHLHCTGGAVD